MLNNKNTNILFVLKKRENCSNSSYSFSSGLFNSARFIIEGLTKKGYNDITIIEAQDGNDIWIHINKHKPKIVILEALWVTPDKIKELCNLYTNITFVIRIHSEIPFLAVEGMSMSWLSQISKLKKNGYKVEISVNSDRMEKDLDSVLQTKTILLPNYYVLDNNDSKQAKRYNSKIINIGCFGAVRPMKNMLKQAVAAINYADSKNKTLYFNINSSRVEQGENVLKNIIALFEHHPKHILIEHPWMEHNKFIELVKTMDIGMQVSLSETFNIVTADFVANNIPIIVSNEIEWVANWCKCDPTSTESMVNALNKVKFMKCFNYSRKKLETYNKNSLNKWEKYINSII